jgi:glycosyltransferase involved in cell wall biosynthesis
MLMSRAALEAVGVFDEETFGRGYGEENDWCMRAQRRGFRNLVTPNLYVYHHHGGSFESEEKIALQTKHQLVLRKRYPELFLQNESFSERDPLSCTRLAIALKMASNNEPHGPFLMMDVDVPAGVPSGAVAYRDWLARSLSKRGKTVIILTYDPGQAVMRVRVSSPPTPEPRVVGVVSGDLENRIADLVDLLAPKRILVTNLVWYPHPESSAAEVRASEVPYLVFAHDFCSICPSWFLINKDGTYCGGETQTDVCDRCLPQNSYADYRSVYPEFSPSIMRWRSSMKQLLDGAQAVVCFSQSTLDVLNRVFGLLRGVVIPHVVAAPEEEGVRSERVLDGVLAVAVIGSMQHIKGVDVVRGLVTAVRRARLPIRFVVIGSWPGYADHFSSVDHRLRVTGAYRREDLPRLLEESGASLVMIPSIWPETFSYTTSEAILLGYPVVCFDLGAPAERVRTYDCGMVVEDISAEGMIGALKHILDHPDLIEYWSRNTARYSPPTEVEHIDAILRCLGESSHRGDNRLVDTQEATS